MNAITFTTVQQPQIQIIQGNRVSATGENSVDARSRPDDAGAEQVAVKSQGGAVEQSLSAEEQRKLTELAARDREVRAHEAAHANVGGVYAGAPRYSYTRGPDGRNYAVGGEVSIDVSPVPGDPHATIAKAQLVRRAALAPAEPSAQDRAVANAAVALEQQARAELQAQNRSSDGEGIANIATDNAFARIAQPVPEPGEIISELI